MGGVLIMSYVAIEVVEVIINRTQAAEIELAKLKSEAKKNNKDVTCITQYHDLQIELQRLRKALNLCTNHYI